MFWNIVAEFGELLWFNQNNYQGLKVKLIFLTLFIYRYHTITDVYTTALLLTKPSSDDDSGFRHGFEVEVTLLLIQGAPAIPHYTIRFVGLSSLCRNAVSILIRLSFMLNPFVYVYFLLSVGETSRVFWYADVWLWNLGIRPL